MRISRGWKYFIGFILIVAIIPLIILLLIRLIPEPPTGLVENARMALSRAVSNNAETYSSRLYNDAKAFYDSAMKSWREENKRFIYFRDYDSVARFAELSAEKAELAMEHSKTSVATLQISIKHKIDSLNNLVGHINRIFKAYPLSSELWNRISKGALLLKESQIAYGKGQFIQADRKITDSEYLLTSSYDTAAGYLKEYFDSFPLWQRWMDKTIKESRQKSCYSIIIDKYSRKCFVYLNGIKTYEYNVELGQNWVGDKRLKGDKATPEGMYTITKKLGSNKTKYYKALLLDYPNETDMTEFKKEIAEGTLPRSAKIGSLIEIHGNGGKGIDWTEGCMALVDSEMDVVFKIAREGTTVTIVGSTVSLDKVLNL